MTREIIKSVLICQMERGQIRLTVTTLNAIYTIF